MTTNTTTARGFQKLSPEDLFSLEQYSKQRPQFRPQVLAHKKRRTLQVGPNATILFEDRLTVQYQVQEMLRIERIFESAGIADELGAYNPLIPDGSNWKATLLIEYPDPEERKVALAGLKGVEDRCWVQVAGHERVYRDCGRGPRARERREDLGGAFRAFRADAGHGGGREGRRCGQCRYRPSAVPARR